MPIPRTIERTSALRVGGMLGVICAMITALLAIACDSVPSVATFEPTTDPARLFMSLELNHRAVNLSTASPYDTLRLVATPLDGNGQPMNGLPAASFRSADTTRVVVTEDGLLQARAATNGVAIIAEVLTADNIRHADTAYVKVTTLADPPQLDRFEIMPQTPYPDTAVWTMVPDLGMTGAVLLQIAGTTLLPTLRLDALTASGATIAGLEVEYRSLDPRVAIIDNRTGAVTPIAPGKVRIVASTSVYGVTAADTAEFEVILPLVSGVIALPEPLPPGGWPANPSEVTILQSGYVFWWNTNQTIPTEIVFEDPANVEALPAMICMIMGESNCSGGDIAPFGGMEPMFPLFMRGRRFPVPGVYEYTITATGETGRVIVVEGSAP